MGPLGIRRTLQIAGHLTAACVALPHTAFSQPDLASSEAQLQVVDAIQEMLSRADPNSAELIEPMTALGELYQRDGDNNLAAAAFEQARHVVRANYGFSSLEEAVAFDITKFGTGENVEILNSTPGVAPSEHKELISLIEQTVFRPRVKSGQVVEKSRIVMRYFVNE